MVKPEDMELASCWEGSLGTKLGVCEILGLCHVSKYSFVSHCDFCQIFNNPANIMYIR
jgi:hypothetical protein